MLEVVVNIATTDIIFIMGDVNTTVDYDIVEGVKQTFNEHNKNNLCDIITENLVMTHNTFFQNKPPYKRTWLDIDEEIL